MKIVLIVIWPNTKTRCVKVKQMKRQKREKNPKESEPKYQFQGQSERLQHWFDIDPYWIEDNFMTREPDF